MYLICKIMKKCARPLLWFLKEQNKSANFNYFDGNSPDGIYLFKVINRNIRARCEICSKLTIETPKRRQ